MDKITSFTVDHNKLYPGIYISRKDGDITTYDLRTKRPNTGEVMDNETMHTTEHMFATFVRNSKIKDDVIYFGPMGCQTGFYLLVRNSDDDVVLDVIKDVLSKIIVYEGPVFGYSETECGNYKTLRLESAIKLCREYFDVVENWKKSDLIYNT